MKIARKIMVCVMAFSMLLSCIGFSANAAAIDDLTTDNFSLTLNEADNTLSVALVCNKEVSGWGAGGGIMAVTNSSGEDATQYFTLSDISTKVGDGNDSVNRAEWSSTAEDTEAGDTLASGIWTEYKYTLAENIPSGEYRFIMNFSDGDNYEAVGGEEDYSISGQSVSATYTVGTTPPTTATYTADLSTDTAEDVKVGEPVSIDILVGGTEGQFASSEMNLTYEGLTYTGATANGADIDTTTAGKIKIIDHGETTSWTNGTVKAYTLNFTVDSIAPEATGEASVTLVDAALSTSADASGANLTPAVVTVNTKEFNVTPADLTVTLPEGMTSTGTTVVYGENFEFEATDKNYTYELSAVKTGTESVVAITPNGDGKWVIEGVTSDVTVTIVSKTPKTYTITFSNVDHIKNQTSDSVSFVYGTAGGFSFVLKDDEAAGLESGTQYVVNSIKYDATGDAVAHTPPTTDTNRTFTIATEAITGDITITTSANTVNPNQFTVTLPSNYPELSAKPTVVNSGASTVLTLDPVAGYKYTVKYQIGDGAETEISSWTDGADGEKTATISNITANVKVTVTRDVDASQFNVTVMNEYVAMQGKTVHLVRVSATLDDGYDFTYGGEKMYWSTGYESAGEYVYLVITDAGVNLSVNDAKAQLGITTAGKKGTIVYDGNVNLADPATVDANDAQLVWNMYGADTYSDFSNAATGATMEKYLRADMNCDGKLYTEDAAAIVDIVKNRAN